MMPVETVIHRVRRDITLGMFLKLVMGLAVFACVAFVPPSIKLASVSGVIAVWIALGWTSARGSQLAIDSPALIASGQYDEAERQIDEAVRAFSLFGPVKLRALHQLAMLRQAQQRWAESAALSRAVLRQRMGAARGLNKSAGLMLARSLLELNDLHAAYAAIVGLYQAPIGLDEALNLLWLQTDYESRIEAWPNLFNAAAVKCQLAELMPSPQAARTQALLALAALKCDRAEWAQWLRQRAELLADVPALVAERPVLRQLWPQIA